MSEYAQLRARLADEYALGPESLHGPQHWKRVEAYGLYLAAATGADSTLVSLFANFHDCCRLNDHHDPEHGLRGAEKARELQATLGLDDERFETLFQACAGHTDLVFSHDRTIGTCWDADRLDLDRVDMDIDPYFLSTVAGKELALLPVQQRWDLVGIL